MISRRVAIVGVGYTQYTSPRREVREKSEISMDAVREALRSTGLNLRDIEATFYSSVDGFEGYNRSERLQPSFGQNFNLPVYSINTGGTGGASALKEAYHFVAAGIYDLVLVYCAPTFNVPVDNNQVLNTAWHPLFEKPIGENVITFAARMARKYMDEYGWSEEIFARVAAKNHMNAANNPYAHLRKGFTYEEIMESPIVSFPLRLYECCPSSSGGACLILASEEKAKEIAEIPVWIKTVESNTDTFLTGYRDSLKFDRLEVLANRVYKKTGIKEPLKEIDVAETFIPFANYEFLEYEALGFCDHGKGPELLSSMVTTMEGDLPVNPSGSVLCTNAGIAASLTRFGEIARQLMGKAGNIQVRGTPKVGLAHAWGGSNGQFHVLGILYRD